MIEYLITRPEVDSWFITHTFKDYVSERKAYALLRRWFERLGNAHDDVVKGSPGLKWVTAQEWQKRNVVHFHSILSGVRLNDLSRKRWEIRWGGMEWKDAVTGDLSTPCGFARIYDARRTAAPYLAKYVGKTDAQSSALRWGGSWLDISFPGSVDCHKT
jgi:hypothetical protein